MDSVYFSKQNLQVIFNYNFLLFYFYCVLIINWEFFCWIMNL
jgi:hypothetical protein